MVDVAKRITSLREQAGMTTNRLSTASGMSQSYIRKLELGTSSPTVATLNSICETLKIDIEDFFKEEELSLEHLRAIKVLRTLTAQQARNFCALMVPDQVVGGEQDSGQKRQ